MRVIVKPARSMKRIGLTGDWHVGNPGCHFDGIRRCLERFRSMPWLHVGDLVEGITPDDIRFDVEAHGGVTLLGAAGKAAKLLSFAKTTCMGFCDGNHELTPSRKVGSIGRLICDCAGIPHLGQVGYIRLGPLTIFAAHGSLYFSRMLGVPERSATNRAIRLREYLAPFRSDLKIVGHGHTYICAPPVSRLALRAEFDRNSVRDMYESLHGEWCVMVPCLCRQYMPQPSFAQARLFPPAVLGWAEAIVERGKIVAVEHIDDKGRVREVTQPRRIG